MYNWLAWEGVVDGCDRSKNTIISTEDPYQASFKGQCSKIAGVTLHVAIYTFTFF